MNVHSMTGYGKATASEAGIAVTVEIAAVNRKQRDVRAVLARQLTFLEPCIRNTLQQSVSRGSLSVTVSCELGAEYRKEQIRIDEEVAHHVANRLRALASEAGLDPLIRVADLLTIPGVVTETSDTVPTEQIEKITVKALHLAVSQLRAMQLDEGRALAEDVVARTELLGSLLERIANAETDVVVYYRKRLHDRIQEIGVPIDVDDERLAKEVAFIAERADTAEETTRLRSHLAQFAESLAADAPPGRRLDFLCQEMSREINTLCAKTRDTGVAALGLEFKTELGRIREQVQNIE